MNKLSIGRAWDETSGFLRAEVRLVAPVALATFAAPTAVAGWISPSGEMTAGGAGVMMTFLLLVFALIGQMTIAALAIGARDRLGAVMGRAAGRVYGPISAAILVFLPISILIIVVLGAILGSKGLTDPSQITPKALAATPEVAVMVLVVLLALMFVAVRLLPMPAVAIRETARPFALLGRCWTLTKGHFLKLFGLIMLMLVAALVLSGATTTVVGTLIALVAGDPRPFSLPALLIGLANGLASAAVTAVSAAMVGRVYLQLAEEGAAKD